MQFKRYALFPLLTALLFLPPGASAQSIDCDNLPDSIGPIPAEVLQGCAQSVVVANQSAGPDDLSGGVNNSAGDAFVTFAQNLPDFFETVVPSITQDAEAFINAGDFAGNDLDTWYALDNLNNFFSVDVVSGEVTPIATTDAPENGETWTGMTWDYETSTMYAISAASGFGSLYSIDVTDGSVELIAALSEATLPIAVASDPTSGQLYVIDIGTDALLTLDKTTGEVAEVGPLGFDANFGQGMDFDNDDGTLYAYAVSVDGGNATHLRIIDTETGDGTTIVGALGGDDPGGLNQMGSGSSMTLRKGVASEGAAAPNAFELSGVYPNPLRTNGSVSLRIDRAEQVRIAVYDVLGRELALLHDGALLADRHTFTVEAASLPSGLYFVSVRGESLSGTRKFIVTH